MKQIEEKFASLVKQLNKADLQKSDLIGLNARVKALSVKANHAPSWAKPIVYAALTIGVMAIAVIVIRKTGSLLSPPTSQPPPTPQSSPPPPSQPPVCNPHYNPFISDCDLLEDPTPKLTHTTSPTPPPLSTTPKPPPAGNSNTPQPSLDLNHTMLSQPSTLQSAGSSLNWMDIMTDPRALTEAKIGAIVGLIQRLIAVHHAYPGTRHSWHLQTQTEVGELSEKQEKKLYRQVIIAGLLSARTLFNIGAGAVVGAAAAKLGAALPKIVALTKTDPAVGSYPP